MSRSRKKTPISGNTTAKSEKKFKQASNRNFRHRVHQALYAGMQGDLSCFDILPEKKEITNIWDGPKDGKSYFLPFEKLWRK